MTKRNCLNFFNTRSKRAFGLLGFALSLGATGALVTQNSSQNIARNTSSNATTRTSLLKRDNQGLKSTRVECDARFGRAIGLGTCRIIPDPGPSWEVYKEQSIRIGKLEYTMEEYRKRLFDSEARFDRIEARLDSIDEKLSEISKTNKLLEKIYQKMGKN